MILLIDNYDSFTYNIAHALGSLNRELTVVRNDAVSPAAIEDLSPEAILISPGPGRPEDAGISCDVIDRFKGRVPIMGVCLGHQCLAEVLGAKVVRGGNPVHDKTSAVFHDGRTIYTGLRNPFTGARYHSLVVPEESLPAHLEVSAYTHEGVVMGLRCPSLKLEGVQFHPESIATPLGPMIFKNFLNHYLDLRLAA